MLTNFVRKKRKVTSTKICNIEEIQATLKSYDEDTFANNLLPKVNKGGQDHELVNTKSLDQAPNRPSSNQSTVNIHKMIDINFDDSNDRSSLQKPVETNSRKILLRSFSEAEENKDIKSVNKIKLSTEKAKKAASTRQKVSIAKKSNIKKKKSSGADTKNLVKCLEDYSFVSDACETSSKQKEIKVKNALESYPITEICKTPIKELPFVGECKKKFVKDKELSTLPKKKINGITVELPCKLSENLNVKNEDVNIHENISVKEEQISRSNADKDYPVASDILTESKIYSDNDYIISLPDINLGQKHTSTTDSLFIKNSNIESFSQAQSINSFKIDKKICLQPSDVLLERPFDSEMIEKSLELRKLKVTNHATRKVEISYSLASAYINFPKTFKEISTLYKILETVVEFNKRRGQTVIFSKYVDSLERTFKHRIEINLLEKINYLCEGAVIFNPLSVIEDGINTKTFIIDIIKKVDIDYLLFINLIEKYETWLLEKNIEGKVIKFHPDFLKSDIDLEKKQFLFIPEPIEEKFDIKKIVKSKSNDILERIREKERLRKEQFIKECTKSLNHLETINDIFKLADKKAIELEEIIFKIGGYDCKSAVLKSVEGIYEIRTIKGIEYLIKK